MNKLLVLLFLGFFSLGLAQENKPEYWQDIENFKQKDLVNPPPQGVILLIGSSSFTMWQDVEDYFPGKTFINRGFGGSRIVDLNYYSDYLLSLPSPKQILIYCGENDIAYHLDPVKGKEVLKRFQNFYAKLRKAYPEAQIDYLSMKHSPSRDELWPEMKKGNNKIKRFIQKQPRSGYIELNESLKDANGEVRRDVFLEDMLHLNSKGYKLWAEVMLPYLK